MEVICFQEKAFYEILDHVYERFMQKEKRTEFKWIAPDEAMNLLNVKKTKLQELRTQGRIRYTQPDRKIILYDRDSINQYLEDNAKDTFR